jgi:small nuclear ribonucleoprotein (snRNP)-like protein
MNLVLDDVKEITRGMQDHPSVHPHTSCVSYLPLTNFPIRPISTSIPPKANPKPDDEGNTSSRPLGLLVARGTLLVLISPLDGSEEIENPFVQQAEEEGAPAI